MATEIHVQKFVHELEQGRWVKWVHAALLLVATIFGIYRFIFTEGSPGSFRGLSSAKGMEQAAIAREIARGNGFSTKMIRPIAIEQFTRPAHLPGGGRAPTQPFPVANIPDTYHAPLGPFVNSFALRLFKSEWKMSTRDIVYACDRVIAVVAMLLFIASAAVNYQIARRLFDERLALLGLGLILISDTFWQFSMSGLPQMLMLLLFSCALFALVRATEALQARDTGRREHFFVGEEISVDPVLAAQTHFAQTSGEVGPPGGGLSPLRIFFSRPIAWLFLAAFFFALLALTHALTIWIFAGALIFCGIYFRARRGHWVVRVLKNPALLMAVFFLLLYAPWLVRNYKVCHSPIGLSPYSLFYQIRGTESQIMRSQELSFAGINPLMFRMKLTRQIMNQLREIYGYYGSIVVAPLFFLALLHPFKGRLAAAFRWCIVPMWIFAVVGMSAFGLQEPVLDPNDLHILFAPVFTFYGMALVLTMWSRLEITVRLVRYAFIGAIYFFSGLPLLNTLFGKIEGRVQWPPYVPPFISVLGDWVDRPDEYLCSDMPWAVAWYADRKCLWLPMTVKEFVTLNDEQILHGRLVGLYLTPVTGNRAFIADIVKGEYKDWYPFIIRNVQIRDFPLHSVTALPIDNECVFYCDRDRWSTRVD